MRKGMVSAFVVAVTMAAVGPQAASAQGRALVAEARDITFWQSDSREFIVGVYASVPASPAVQIGFLVRCVRKNGFLEMELEFGHFPPEGKVVQGMLRGPDGRLERLEQPITVPNAPGDDVHVVDIENPGRARADLLLGMLFRRGDAADQRA